MSSENIFKWKKYQRDNFQCPLKDTMVSELTCKSNINICMQRKGEWKHGPNNKTINSSDCTTNIPENGQ
jgi:hypothetical protein